MSDQGLRAHRGERRLVPPDERFVPTPPTRLTNAGYASPQFVVAASRDSRQQRLVVGADGALAMHAPASGT